MTVIEHFPERCQIGRWDNGRFAGPFDADMRNGRPDLETIEYVRADLHRGAVAALEQIATGPNDQADKMIAQHALNEIHGQ